LVEAGYGEGFTTTLRTPVGIYHNDAAIAEAVARQLAELNIVVRVETVSNWGVYAHQLLNDDTAPLFLLGINSRGDALEHVSYLSSDFPFNPSGWRNESFEKVVERAANTLNNDARNRLLDEAQAIAYEEAPMVWLWRPYDFYGVSNTLNWAPRPDGLVNLYKPETSPAEGNE
jgi:ABC-type transport system substrate-binding protein